MALPSYPTVLLEAIAADATSGFITSPMPDAPTGTNAASVQAGFPPITMQSELAGGEPPLGQDMNGFLNLITQHTVFLQSGQLYQYDADVVTAIGGYPVGAILGMADGTGIWLNTIPNNASSPDAGSAGWAPLFSYGSTSVAIATGTVTLSIAQAKKSVIIFTGTMTGNATVVMPAYQKDWLFINATNGNFTINVATNTSGGASVNIPQGGFAAPTGAYTIGDGNMYPTVSPLSIPISIAPTALSILQRDNNGYAYAVAYNSALGAQNLTIANIITDQGDGFFQKSSVSWFQSRLAVSGFTGQVSNGQVPQGAVTQYSSVILASAALTGVPTAPTAAIGTATSQVASTAFVNPGSGSTANGKYRKNPDGTIDQWGFVDYSGSGGASITYPITFPNVVDQVLTSSTVGGFSLGYDASASNRSGAVFGTNGLGGTAQRFYWRAIGS